MKILAHVLYYLKLVETGLPANVCKIDNGCPVRNIEYIRICKYFRATILIVALKDISDISYLVMPSAGQERDWVRWSRRRQDGTAGRGRRRGGRWRAARDSGGNILAALVDQDADDDPAAPGHGQEGQARRVR